MTAPTSAALLQKILANGGPSTLQPKMKRLNLTLHRWSSRECVRLMSLNCLSEPYAKGLGN